MSPVRRRDGAIHFSCALFISPYYSTGLSITTIINPRRNTMELLAVKTLDDLGRITIPKEVRQEKNWRKGTAIGIYANNDTIILDICPPDHENDAEKIELSI